MRRINYISNLDLGNQSGGWGGINFRMKGEIDKFFDVNFTMVNPRPLLSEKIISKVQRILGGRGDFFFFSKNRLRRIAEEAGSKMDSNAEVDFFFGATPWIQMQQSRPYAVYLDASFKTYLNIYSSPRDFAQNDIDRICSQEARWLEKASWIFWGSRWARDEAAVQYKFDPTLPKHLVINTGGNLPIPTSTESVSTREPILLFISLNFEKKGGMICFEAFQRLKELFPQAKLKIIGERPPDSVLNYADVIYAGLLNKRDPSHLQIFVDHMRSASFLIHPTKMDTMGAVIIEAGYYGCPSIAPRTFGIPDLVVDGVTGFLMDDLNGENISKVIGGILQNERDYKRMREACFQHCTQELSWEAIGLKIFNHLTSAG